MMEVYSVPVEQWRLAFWAWVRRGMICTIDAVGNDCSDHLDEVCPLWRVGELGLVGGDVMQMHVLFGVRIGWVDPAETNIYSTNQPGPFSFRSWS